MAKILGNFRITRRFTVSTCTKKNTLGEYTYISNTVKALWQLGTHRNSKRQATFSGWKKYFVLIVAYWGISNTFTGLIVKGWIGVLSELVIIIIVIITLFSECDKNTDKCYLKEAFNNKHDIQSNTNKDMPNLDLLSEKLKNSGIYN